MNNVKILTQPRNIRLFILGCCSAKQRIPNLPIEIVNPGLCFPIPGTPYNRTLLQFPAFPKCKTAHSRLKLLIAIFFPERTLFPGKSPNPVIPGIPAPPIVGHTCRAR